MNIIHSATKAALLIFLVVIAFSAFELGAASEAVVAKDATQCIAAQEPTCLFMIF